MKNISLIFTLFFSLTFSQKSQVGKINLQNYFIYYFYSTKKQIDSLKKKEGENFYIIADDENYYSALSIEKIEKKRIPFKIMKKRIFKIQNINVINIPKDFAWGGFFIYKDNKYEFIHSIDMEAWLRNNN